MGTTELGTPPAPPDPNAPPAPGAPGYDLWAVNQMLRDNGFDGWQMAGVQPVQTSTEKTNPLYNPAAPDPSQPPTISTPQNEYVVNVRNPKTGEIKQFTVAKLWQGADGSTTQTDPGPGAPFTYSATGVKDVQTANKVGHTDLRTIGDTIYGTNTENGNFEAVPNAPKVPGSWTNVRQVEKNDGSTVWVGEDPSDHQIKNVPGMPELSAANKGWGNPYQVEQQDGSKVWYGTDPSDKMPKPIPGMPTVPRAPTGPGSITSKGGTVYVQQPDGTYKPASGIPDPNPPRGTTQVILGPDGFLYRQTSRGDGTFDPDPTFDPVPFSDAAKQARSNLGAPHTAGQTGTKVINGMVYHVTYRGGSDDAYDVDTSQPATPMPGASSPTSIATSADQPRIVQRMPDGSVQSVDNPNYLPTDPAQRTTQLQQQASAKLAELQGKISSTYTQDQAQKDFDAWWNTTVEPAKLQIQQAQQQKQSDFQTKQAAEQRANLTTAQTAGQNAVEAARAQLPYMVGPGYHQALQNITDAYSSGKAPAKIDWSQMSFKGPDLNSIAQQATNSALAHLSPTAAGGGTPGLAQMAPNIDITQGLNRTNYQFGVPTPTTTIAPDGTVTVSHTAPTSMQAIGAGMAGAAGAVGAGVGGMLAPATAAPTPTDWSQSAPNFGSAPPTWPNYTYQP